MEPEERKLLDETHALTQENNKMLKSMRRSMRWAQIGRLVYWLFIIGSAVGAYFIFQPYIDNLKSAYEGADSLIKSIKGGGE